MQLDSLSWQPPVAAAAVGFVYSDLRSTAAAVAGCQRRPLGGARHSTRRLTDGDWNCAHQARLQTFARAESLNLLLPLLLLRLQPKRVLQLLGLLPIELSDGDDAVVVAAAADVDDGDHDAEIGAGHLKEQRRPPQLQLLQPLV